MIDDALDYGSSDIDIGKNIGDDLAEGKPTLPLIRAMQQCSDDDKDLLRSIIEQGGTEQTEKVLGIIQSTDAIDYTFRQAELEADQAIKSLESIPGSAQKEALVALANYAVRRNY